MLVLSRKAGQQVKIGDSIILTITKIHGQRVTVGIEAPRDTTILRAEIDRSRPVSDHPQK